jgi:CRP-like cAMP-binding protein
MNTERNIAEGSIEATPLAPAYRWLEEWYALEIRGSYDLTAGLAEITSRISSDDPARTAATSGKQSRPPMRWPESTVLGRLAEPLREGLLRLGTFREYPGDKVIFREGDPSTFVVLLLNGWVKVTAASGGGVALLAVRQGGDIVGELAGLDSLPRSATVTTAGTVLAKVIGSNELVAFLDREPEAWHAVSRAIAAKLRWATRRRADFSGCPVTMRLARVIIELERAYGAAGPGGDGRTVGIALTQSELAALVGAAEPTVRKILRELRHAGVLDTGYRSLVIRDMAALRRAAGFQTPGR